MRSTEKAVIRRKCSAVIWSIFRFFILFGLSFIILYPLIYMVSCAFRSPEDMNDPTVIWIPKHPTLAVIRETMEVMDYWKTLCTTFLLNVGCAALQVISCAVTGYGFARFKFRGRGLLLE